MVVRGKEVIHTGLKTEKKAVHITDFRFSSDSKQGLAKLRKFRLRTWSPGFYLFGIGKGVFPFLT